MAVRDRERRSLQEGEQLPFLQPSGRAVGFAPGVGRSRSSSSAIPAAAEILGPNPPEMGLAG